MGFLKEKKKAKNKTIMFCVSFSIMSNSLQLWTIAFWAPLSMEFARQENWSGLPDSSPWDHPHQWNDFLYCRWILYHLSHQGSPKITYHLTIPKLGIYIAKNIIQNYTCIQCSTVYNSQEMETTQISINK